MSNISANVYFLNDNKNLMDCISVFLDRIAQNSENTMKTYNTSIRMFFRDMRGKELEHITNEDIIFTKLEIQRYQIDLRDKFKSTTVNNRFSALRKLYEKLEESGFEVDANWFKLDRYKEYDKESYDPMTTDEIREAIELVSGTRKGFEKSMLIKVAYSTAFRKKSIQDLKWSDIYNHDGDWIIKTLGKGNKWDYKKISEELYYDLKRLNEKNDSVKIFKLTDKTINRMMNYIRENIDFGNRIVTFHSLKKSSINEVALITNYDIKAMQRQGNHSSPTTTLQDYMQTKSIDDLIIVDIDSEIDLSVLDTLTRCELLKLVKSMDRGIQMRMIEKIESSV